MKAYLDTGAGSKITPLLWNAQKSAWIISPYIGKDYAEKLVSLSQKGVDVRIITTNDALNLDSIAVLERAKNPNLNFLVLDKNSENATFIHSKIYLVDSVYGVSGSANLTYRGLNTNVESLSITETPEEATELEHNFMKAWLKYENKNMKEDELTSATRYLVKNALPIVFGFEEVKRSGIEVKELIFYSYYSFEFSFRASVGRRLFQDHCFVTLDAQTSKVVDNQLLVQQLAVPTENYAVNTENKYKLTIAPAELANLREAKEVALNFFINKNTRHYSVDYGNRSYDRLFVPFKTTISTLKSIFVQVPVWYLERKTEGNRYEDARFAYSGKLWYTRMYCPLCQTKIWLSQAVQCSNCHRVFCPNCIQESGIIFRKKLCTKCNYQINLEKSGRKHQ